MASGTTPERTLQDIGRRLFGSRLYSERLNHDVVDAVVVNAGLFSSATCEWNTPDAFFKQCVSEFGPFDLDVCADMSSARAQRHFKNDGILGGLGELWAGKVWMNPPYGRAIGDWVRKAHDSAKAGATVVCLLPARTDTAWWHDYCMRGEIRFVRGRIHFNDKGPAPFPSALVIFRKAKS